MAFPVTDTTDQTGMVFVEKIEQNKYRMYNDTGATISQGDYIYFNGMIGVALQKALSTAYFDMQIDDMIEVQADDLVTGADTFGTLYQQVYFNAADKAFGDSVGSGIPVGILSQVKDSNGSIKFFNVAKFFKIDGAKVYEWAITADATSGLTFDPGFSYKILDVVAISTATNASATVTLSDGTNAITNAIDIDTVDTRIAATTIDQTYRTISGTDVLTATTAGAADRCILLLTIEAV